MSSTVVLAVAPPRLPNRCLRDDIGDARHKSARQRAQGSASPHATTRFVLLAGVGGVVARSAPMSGLMAYRVLRCIDCGRPIIAAFGNANRVIVGFTLNQADGDHETWTHADHDRAPEEVLLDGPDQPVGATMRDLAGERCVVTKIEDGKSWGVRVSDLARQTPDW